MAGNCASNIIEVINPNPMNYPKSDKPLEEPTVIQHSHEWLNDHGMPSYSYLQKLAEGDAATTRDELMELAETYDISYDRTTSPQELIDKIWLRISSGATPT